VQQPSSLRSSMTSVVSSAGVAPVPAAAAVAAASSRGAIPTDGELASRSGMPFPELAPVVRQIKQPYSSGRY
jgi:hypothetical protein